MIKDTFFSPSRFMNLCRKEMVENWKPGVLRVAMMYGVMAITFVWNGHYTYKHFTPLQSVEHPDVDPAWPFLLRAFVVFFVIFGLLAASFTMEKMKAKTGRLRVLMTPAAPFEKFFSSWLLSTLVYVVVFLIVFRLADYTRVLIYMVSYPDFKVIAPVDFGWLVGKESGVSVYRTTNGMLGHVCAYLFFQSCFVLGSAVWPKNSFIKTVATGVTITIVYGLIIAGVAHLVFPERFNYHPGISDETIGYIAAVVALCFALMNWMLAYSRFKESEIINRM